MLMTTEFKVGDIVEAFGCRGVVDSINGYKPFPIRVMIEGLDCFQHFTHDGRYNLWHKLPSLKLIERKKEKKLVEHWPAIFVENTNKNYVSDRLFKNEEEAIRYFTNNNFIRLAKELPAILLEVEDE